MPEINLFLDSSALIAGIVSVKGAPRVLLLLAESGHIAVTISEQVLTETERAIARKVAPCFKRSPPSYIGLEGADLARPISRGCSCTSEPDIPCCRCSDCIGSYAGEGRLPGYT